MHGRDGTEWSRRLRLSTRADTVTIEVHGLLDAAVVSIVGKAAAAALQDRRARVQIDLGQVDGHTEEGLAAFAGLQARFAPGAGARVAYRAGSAAGQEALLAAYTRAG